MTRRSPADAMANELDLALLRRIARHRPHLRSAVALLEKKIADGQQCSLAELQAHCRNLIA